MACWPCGSSTNPSGTLCGRDLRDPGQSIAIDRGGNYISLALSANPRSSAGDGEKETKKGSRRLAGTGSPQTSQQRRCSWKANAKG